MGWVEGVVTVLGAWAWPIVVLVAVLVLKKEIGKLVTRLTRFSGAGVEAEFQQEVEAANELAEAVTSDAPNELASSSDIQATVVGASRDDLMRDAEDHPLGAMIKTWNGVEYVLERGFRFDARRSASPAMAVEDLRRRGLVTDELVSLTRRLQSIRNQVVHGRINPTTLEAQEFIQAVWRLIATLKSAAPPLDMSDGPA